MSLSRYEQETVITFNETGDPASIFTYNPALIRHLDKLTAEREEIREIRTEEFEGSVSKEYELPKGWIKVRANRILSEEEKKRLSDNAKERFRRS